MESPSLVMLPSGGGCYSRSPLSGRLKTTTPLLLHCLQACKAWTWDWVEAVGKENNGFLFIAWSGLPLTLREPLHLQDVLPKGQRQVVCRAAAGERGAKLLLTQGGFVLDCKGRSLHIRACHLSHWEESVLSDFQENSIWL